MKISGRVSSSHGHWFSTTLFIIFLLGGIPCRLYISPRSSSTAPREKSFLVLPVRSEQLLPKPCPSRAAGERQGVHPACSRSLPHTTAQTWYSRSHATQRKPSKYLNNYLQFYNLLSPSKEQLWYANYPKTLPDYPLGSAIEPVVPA